MSVPANSNLIPLDSFWFESGPPDIRVLLTDYLTGLGDDNQMTEREDQLMTALRDTYASRSELSGMRVDILNKLGEALDHLKEGNGTPGLYSIDKRLDRIEQRAEPIQRVKMHVVTAVITLVLGMVSTFVYSKLNTAPAVVAKEVATDKVTIDALKIQLEEIKNTLQSKQPAVPVVAPRTNRYSRKHKPSEKQSIALPDGALIVGDKPYPSYSSARIVSLSPRDDN